MNITLSTRNPSKALQVGKIFEGSSIVLLTLDEAGIEGEAVEDGETLRDNALKKARFAHKPGEWAMADDTGIFIDVLEGRPGVRSARWAGEKATTEEITSHTLTLLKGKENRAASFKTVVALIDPKGIEHIFEGSISGQVLTAPKAPAQPKMPYSGIFLPDGSHQVWAEMTTEQENEISHRGIAFRAAREYLEGLIK